MNYYGRKKYMRKMLMTMCTALSWIPWETRIM